MAWEPLPHEARLFEDVYLDESSQTGNRFLVIGGIVISRTASEQFESDIIEARGTKLAPTAGSDGKPREIAWNSVKKGDFDAYKTVVDAYFGFARKRLPSALDSIECFCSVVDTSVKGRHYSGKRGKLGFNREIYYHCMTVARMHKKNLFHVYPDERENSDPETHDPERKLKNILCRGLKKEGDRREWAFRRLKLKPSHEVQALQVSDLLIGAVAYRLNRHYDAPKANEDKRALCEHILKTGQVWDHIREKSFTERPYPRFRLLFRRHAS